VKATRSFVLDERGHVATSTLGFTITWFTICGVFMMNVQLGQLCHRRDAVDHSAAIAADVAEKTYCAKQESVSAAESEAKKAVDPVLDTAGDECKVSVRPTGSSEDPGAQELEVALDCTFPCNIPFAAQIMCKDGRVKFSAKLKTVAMGCDGKGG
jgi:hypothetical protein